MKHYKHIFTDWICKLRDIPMLQRSAFRDLVENSVCCEKRASMTVEEAYRVCGAFTRNERSAVRAVLKAHFVQDGGRFSCRWAEELLRSQREQQERLRAMREDSGRAQFREQILERDGHRCVYCGADGNLQLDHVFPRSRGGLDAPQNLVAACRRCNASKGAKTPDEWTGGRAIA